MLPFFFVASLVHTCCTASLCLYVCQSVHDLPTLQERREDLRLTFLYKVVRGLVPAIPPEKYLTPQKASRIIRAPNRPDYLVQNPVHNQSRNHDRCLEIPSYNTEQYKQSFFPRTIIAWNKLNTNIVQASSLEAFKSALAVARRRWGAPAPRTKPRRKLRQTTDIIMRRKTLWRLWRSVCLSVCPPPPPSLSLSLPLSTSWQYADTLTNMHTCARRALFQRDLLCAFHLWL